MTQGAKLTFSLDKGLVSIRGDLLQRGGEPVQLPDGFLEGASELNHRFITAPGIDGRCQCLEDLWCVQRKTKQIPSHPDRVILAEDHFIER